MAEAAAELGAILDSAERAASAQDFASAEHYLRQAAAIQEAQFGPDHLDLANTLNNLGIVCERIGKPGDAEASYRRAYAIAKARLAPDDPLVVTSGQNLRDFCAAVDRPFEVVTPPPAPPPPVARPSPPKPVTPLPRPVSTTARPERPASAAAVHSSLRAEREVITPGRSTYRPWIGLAGVIAIVALVAWLAPMSRSSNAPAAAPADPAPVARAESETAKEGSAAPFDETAEPVTTAPPPGDTVNETPRPAPQTPVSLVDARLCRSLSLSDWQCTPAQEPVEPGPIFFYTRIRAGGDTAVRHRWYVNGDLLQSVELRVRANTDAGFRTYSRNTVAGERRGTWTIELRDAGGALLHEERFVVQ